MKISSLLKNKFTISFEFFPPKNDNGEAELFETIIKLEKIKPDFVSVTYGAGGSTREKTRQIVNKISKEKKLNVMAHIACAGHSRAEMHEMLDSYSQAGIDNILALRGDPPAGSGIVTGEGDFPHAEDLTAFIRDNYGDRFCIGAAVFPDKHPQSPDWDHEMKYFKSKVEKGTDFAITQLFFDNTSFYKLIEKAKKSNIEIPIIPGIWPITNLKQIQKIASMCNALIPATLIEKMEKFNDDQESVAEIGIEYAVSQCEDLISNGAAGLHFYTLNKSGASMRIYNSIKDKL